MNQSTPDTVTTESRIDPGAPLLVMVLLVVDSLHFVFAREMRDLLHPTLGAFLLLGVAMVELGAYAAWQGKLRWTTFRHHWPFFVSIGVLVGSSTAINYFAVRFIDAGTASLVSKVGILFTLGFGILWLKDRLTRWQAVGTVVALIGVAVITVKPGTGNVLQLGSLLVMASNFTYALHAAVVKRYGGSIDFVEFFFWRVTATAGFLAMLVTAQGAWSLPSPAALLTVFIAGTVDVTISRALYYLTLRKLTLTLHTILLIMSPVLAVVISVIRFGESPSGQEWLGGAAILLGVALVTIQARRKAAA